ncbi:protein-glutamate O-methyltransferase [Devosia rhodophyticola]|uniref:Chemotaxis protein methyltransferase n=1 Tax=Devosia rhodophyticola TaxID=3026423 RepID=A0ABY7YTE9_9HYPH|nr:protein-glutamate O-methyltransferase [Devosia rhodophyticola]WDR04586.1 protein-glutamate O-methyltransferase [Devosia rhodophyticola]
MEQVEFTLNDIEFERIKARVRAEAGISLSDAKRTLVISRLSKIVRTLGMVSFADYLDFLERNANGAARQDFINALTTNLTRFYREEHHFEHLCAHVEKLIETRPRGTRLRIWSAGCSTGQEPYSIAMSLISAFPELRRWNFKILATDIDTAVLAKAATGIYPDGELSGLAPERARLLEHSAGSTVRVRREVQELVAFKPLNLMTQWPMKGPFDAIFCRNVAIYFDKATQREVFTRFSHLLARGAFLYIGHSENIGSGSRDFKLVGKTIYQCKTGLGRVEAA